MWIIPSNHPLYSHFAPVCLASKEDLSELSEELDHSLMWRSKPLSLKTWSDKWSKVYWLPHLFGRMLKPSHSKVFTEKYIGSLADIHASRSPMLEIEKVTPILDTFGRTLKVALQNRGLWVFGSRMSKDTYRLAYATYLRTFENWVIRLRSEYSRRQKSGLPIEETGSLFSGWKTPSSSECEGGTMKQLSGNAKYKLRDQVNWETPTTEDSANREFAKNSRGEPKLSAQVKWPTPTQSDHTGAGHSTQGGMNLRTAVNWPTASARDWKGQKSNQHEKNSRPLNEVVEINNGQQDQDNRNLNGKPLVLNPAWVIQLMGTTLEKTFFAWREMPSLNRQRNLPSEH